MFMHNNIKEVSNMNKFWTYLSIFGIVAIVGFLSYISNLLPRAFMNSFFILVVVMVALASIRVLLNRSNK